jgi:NhaA family Na+:H+ antiporter
MTDNQNKNEGDHQNPLETGFERVLTPFHEFISDQRVGSVLLLLCTVVALLIANSPLAPDYKALIETPMGFTFGDVSLSMSIHHWINDGLMSLFFFVLGLEIKREVLVGELKDRQQSLPVIIAALGVMLVPAAIFTAFNAGSETVAIK